MSNAPCCMAAVHDQACDCKKRDTLEARIREQRDLLGECERFMGRTDEKDLNVCSPEWWTEFYRLFAKLRAAQEKDR